jgi:hypothetical protein
VANSLLHINKRVALSTDRERERVAAKRERERGGHKETERGILPARLVDQRLVESIRVTMAQPIWIIGWWSRSV